MPRQNDREWEKRFGDFLKLVFDVYLLAPHALATKCNVSDDTVRSWLRGQRLPDSETLVSLLNEIGATVRQRRVGDEPEIVGKARSDFNDYSDRRAFNWLYYHESNMSQFVSTAIKLYFRMAKCMPLPSMLEDEPYKPTGKVRAVVFDFAGTLVRDMPEDSTWHLIWEKLGLERSEFYRIANLYGPDPIKRAEFFEEMSDVIVRNTLTRPMVQEMGRGLSCIKGIRRVFEELSMCNIRICIVSRSERDIIKASLGDLMRYVDEIQSNAFEYDDCGNVTGIVETDFDYEGKARYVMRLAADIHSSTEDIVFVGNSDNDVHVHSVGAHTFCINPSNTYASNAENWSEGFILIDNLEDLLPRLTRLNATENG